MRPVTRKKHTGIPSREFTALISQPIEDKVSREIRNRKAIILVEKNQGNALQH